MSPYNSPPITRYNFDKDNKEKNTWINNGSSVLYNYDVLGRLSNKTLSTGSVNYATSYGYEAGTNGVPTTSRLSSITNNGASISYTYDANNNIKTITQGGSTITYNYNELNEVLREDNQVLNKTIVYAYDTGGNIASKTEYPYTTGTPGTPTRTYNYSYGDTNWKDKLTSYDGKAVTYDAIGNPLTYDGYTYTWEEGRQLKSIAKSGQDTLTFKYNSDGIRTEKAVGSTVTKYHLIGDKVTCETNGTDTIYYTYDSTGNLVSMSLNSTEYYYIRNGQGDITGLFDNSGSQIVSYTYGTWGKLISISGSLANTVGVKNPYRYRGYRYDTETGLYYLQSRYYNPEWGRFINADGIAGSIGELLGHNLFVYCKNNPVNMKDEYGFRPVFTQFDNETDEMRAASLAAMKMAFISSGAGIMMSKNNRKPGKTPPKSWPPLPDNLAGKKPKWNPQGYWEGKNGKHTWDNRSHGAGVDRGDGLQDGHWDDEDSDNRWDRNGNPLGNTPTYIAPSGSPGNTIMGLSGVALVIYFVISEGSRLFLPRNLVPVL